MCVCIFYVFMYVCMYVCMYKMTCFVVPFWKDSSLGLGLTWLRKSLPRSVRQPPSAGRRCGPPLPHLLGWVSWPVFENLSFLGAGGDRLAAAVVCLGGSPAQAGVHGRLETVCFWLGFQRVGQRGRRLTWSSAFLFEPFRED